METFEGAFSDVEQGADSTLQAANGLVRQIKALQKAAKEGNIAAMKRAQERVDVELRTLRQAAANAIGAWPFSSEAEDQYLKTQYAGELQAVAQAQGLTVHERDGRLVAHPSMVRVLAGDRAVRIDKKQTSTIRPSHLVGLLLANQKKPIRHQSTAFLEALYTVYKDMVGDESPDRMLRDSGRVVPLEVIYRRLTYLPGSGREYERTDFARALYDLDASGVKMTKAGATVSFTDGGRTPRGLFTFVGPDGRDVQYYGIWFTEER
ncbi:MAG: hypothetical protein OXC99_11575 [Chloroflexi bacterium]|nr:hypothetical protein [Chloroflexota bacterium]